MKFILFVILIVFANTPVQAYEIKGVVVHIADGDTLTVLTSQKKQIKIRLADIDAPEKHQPFGRKAKQLLAKLSFQKQVTVNISKTNRYGRSIGRISIENTNINSELVAKGMAWVYTKYTDDQKLIALEQLARNSKLGLWAANKPIPPWDWRKGQRENNTSAPSAVIGNKRSKIYHLYNCGSYYKVSKKNQVTFNNEKTAVTQGYKKADNCP